MTGSGLTLTIDLPRWRRHLDGVVAAGPQIVPVAKGNGYGFGLERLAQEAARLQVPALAVGIASEVAQVRDAFGGGIVVLTPWRPDNDLAVELAGDERVITTVSRAGDLAALAAADTSPRVLVEVLTSMRRHGLDPKALAVPDGVRLEGWTIHLPLLEDGRYEQARQLAEAALKARPAPLWLSHLTPDEARRLADDLGADVRLRMGTKLWLGDPGALRTTARVLDVHKVKRGEKVGYRQRPMPMDGHLVILAGGTANGLGMEAPTAAASLRSRAISLATGSLEAAGLALSPYTIGGKKRWFAEPPHMQSSLVFLPGRTSPPSIGDEVPVQLRLTTATVDKIVEESPA